MKASLRDIAEKTGVSITTISRVLNGKGDEFRISKETQEKIFHSAKELNYVPNQTGVNLQSGKTRTIALIVPGLVNPFFANVASLVATEIQGTGYNTLITDSNESIEIEKDELKQMISRNVDGIIIASAGHDGSHINEIDDMGIPIVCIDRYFDNLQVPFVATDNFLGAEMATDHLLKLGHTQIVCIQGAMQSMPNKLRISGFEQIMNKYGIQDYTITGSDFTVQNGYTETLLLLQHQPLPTAIFTLSNTIALGCMKALKENNVKVPEDISLITFDNHPYLDYLSTPLTCVAQPFQDICRIATRLLFSMIDNQDLKTKQVLLRPEILIRDSVNRIL
jgi:LacI family transcriptional regulator